MSDHSAIIALAVLFGAFYLLVAVEICDLETRIKELERKVRELEQKLTGRRVA